jgi:hypothetical protein
MKQNGAKYQMTMSLLTVIVSFAVCCSPSKNADPLSHLAVDCERDRNMNQIVISLVLLRPHSTDFSLGSMFRRGDGA